MIRNFWFGLAALAYPLVAGAQTTPATTRQSVEEADQKVVREALAALHAKAPEQAITLIDPLLADYEKRYAGEKRRIYCAKNTQQMLLYMGQATAAHQDAVALDSIWCTALWLKGYALVEMHQHDVAMPFLERAVALSPSDPQFLTELGYGYQVQKKWQLSYDTYARAAEGAALQDGDAKKRSLRLAWFGQAYALIELGRLDEAEKLLVDTLALTPDDEKIKGELRYVREEKAKRKES
jgi:Flp pilus assembly protein TadD